MKKMLITGGGGFIGSHAAEYFSKKYDEVIVVDNLSRAHLLKRDIPNLDYNWKYLQKISNIRAVKADVREPDVLRDIAQGVNVIIHTAAQTAVTTSMIDPREDFENNVLGVFNVLETARMLAPHPTVVFCSTNKVYGENVNNVPVIEKEKKYEFSGKYVNGIAETFSIDHCEHTPYGSSKLTGDIYMQDYAHLFGIKIGVFRMSCIYGTRQLGVEDQGWVSWFTIATLLDKPITIYGDGKQVRDVLYIQDLLRAYELFINSDIPHAVINTGGGKNFSMSLLELLDILKKRTGKKSKITFSAWRPSDQKVYISDISKANKLLGWKPEVSPEDGVGKLIDWSQANLDLFNA